MNSRKIAVIGQGYVGLPLSMSACSAGWKVIGIDKSFKVVNQLSAGTSHIEDVPNLQLQEKLNTGRYEVTNDYSRVGDCEVVIVCVPTPLDKARRPDLSYLINAIDSISIFLPEDSLLISESTSFPGTVREVIFSRVAQNREDKASNILFASAPERIDPRNRVWRLENTPRLIGGLTREATERATAFYGTFCNAVIPVSSPEIAESAKLLENTFRQVNIALINELVPFFRAMGLDTREVVQAAGTKPYGFMEFFPGAGVGGHCIPIDPLYLLSRSRQLGVDLPLVERADLTNSEMPDKVSQQFINLAGLEEGDNALILGVAYKSGLGDTRESPAIQVANHLSSSGINVFWCDPLVSSFANGNKWEPTISIDGAIVITFQQGLPIIEIASNEVPILDCTGVYKNVDGVSQI